MEDERARHEHDQRVKALASTAVEFKAERVMKRRNSYVPQLDEFGDIDDIDALKSHFARIRRSIDNTKKRADLKVRVADVTQHRLKKDFMESSADGSSITGSALGNSRRRGRKRRTTGEGSLEPASAGTGPVDTAER